MLRVPRTVGKGGSQSDVQCPSEVAKPVANVKTRGGKRSVTSVMQFPRDSAKHVASSKRSCTTEDPEHLRLRSDS